VSIESVLSMDCASNRSKMAAVVTESRICETPGCNSAAKLQCPTCIKLGIQGSYFCSQVTCTSNPLYLSMCSYINFVSIMKENLSRVMRMCVSCFEGNFGRHRITLFIIVYIYRTCIR
jgi:hypothetical protein